MDLGADPQLEGVRFRVWAPKVQRLSLKLVDGPELPMERVGEYFELTTREAGVGSDYLYGLDGRCERPDPVSRHQPHGVHGPSRVVDPNYAWQADWKGIDLQELILYELHVGTYTPKGTFAGVIEKLPYLRELGITALSIMPVAQFPGERNWGYDGVYPFAPQHSYGGPDGLKRLIDACHSHGLALILDVVYNHLGPEGNYLAEFGHYFTDRYKTPWGCAINYDGPYSDAVRDYFIENALYWLTEYHVDGLRLDAVHAIYDFGAHHFLAELKEKFAERAATLGRKAWVIAESDLNDVRLLNPPEQGGYAVDSQWHDDFHHAIHTALTGRKESYFVDFGSLDDVRKSVEEGYVNDGRYSRFRKRHHGSSTRLRPGYQLISFIQNHDQIANACEGERLSQELSLEGQKLAAAVSICSPTLPMLFMGEEWGAMTPFHYFTSFEDQELAKSVREGRLSESVGEGRDPQAIATFKESCLRWDEPNAATLACYRDLIELRKQIPALHDCRKDRTVVTYDEEAQWLILVRDAKVALICNCSPALQDIRVHLPPGTWQPALASFDPKYGGELDPPTQPIIASDALIALPGFGALFCRLA